MKITPLLLLALIIAGCSPVGPDYQRPETAIPATWRSVVPAEEYPESAWWRSFADPVLAELVGEAVIGNRDLRLITARVEQYLALLETTRSRFFPQVSYGFGATRQDNPTTPLSPADPAPYTTFQGALSAAWEIDLWGRIRRADEAARAQVLATREERRAVLVSLVSSVVSSYIVLRGYDRQLEIARETKQSYAETLRIFQLRHRHGTISGIELKQIESQYENAVQTIPQIEALIARQEHFLSVLLGKNPGAIARGNPLDSLLMPPLPAVLPLSLLERRPDIRRAEYELLAANARIGEAKALYFPSISLSGLLGRSSSELSDLFRSGAGLWSLGGNIAGPLISFGAVSGQVAQAEAIAGQALLRYEQIIQEAFREVEDALIGTLKFDEQLQAQQRQIVILTEYARLSKLTFESGNSTYLQVLDAERALFAAHLDIVQAKVNLLSSAVDLYRSLAGEWADEFQGVRVDRRIP